MNPLLIALIIVVSGIIIGIIFDRVILVLLKAITLKTKWGGDEVIVHALKGMTIIWFALAAFYYAMRYIPLTDFWVEQIHKAMLVITILTFTAFISNVIAGLIKVNTSRISQRIPVTSIFTTITNIFVYSIGILILLQSLGIAVTPLLTALGIGGIAVALALQDTLTNLFAGFQILISKKIRPGDYVKLQNGEEGYIQDVNWRVTSIKATDHLIVIPNSKIASSIVLNYHLPEQKSNFRISASVSFSSNLQQVEELTLSTAMTFVEQTEGCSKGDMPLFRFTEFNERGVLFNLIITVDEYNLQHYLRSELIKRLHNCFKEHNISISYPVRHVITQNGNG